MAISVVCDATGIGQLPTRTPFKAFVDGRLRRWLPTPWYWRFRAWRQGQFEGEMRLLPLLCDRSRTSIDVGASIGAYTVHLLLNSARCWAFEPRPRAAGYLAGSLTTRRDPRLRVEAVALSDRCGEARLRVALDDAGRSTVEEANAMEDVGEYAELRVPARRLDDYGRLVGPVGFIKVDVEGHEEAVLRGAAGVLARDRPALLVEVEERHKPGAITAVRKLLGEFGYRGYFFRDRLLHRIESFSAEAYQDVARIGEKIHGELAYVNNFVFLAGRSLARMRHLVGEA